jgi:hypothetical protein
LLADAKGLAGRHSLCIHLAATVDEPPQRSPRRGLLEPCYCRGDASPCIRRSTLRSMEKLLCRPLGGHVVATREVRIRRREKVLHRPLGGCVVATHEVHVYHQGHVSRDGAMGHGLRHRSQGIESNE